MRIRRIYSLKYVIRTMEGARHYLNVNRNIFNLKVQKNLITEDDFVFVEEVSLSRFLDEDGEPLYLYWLFIPCEYGTLICMFFPDNYEKLPDSEISRIKDIAGKLVKALSKEENQGILKNIFSEKGVFV